MEMIFTYNNYKNSIAILSGYQAKWMAFSPGTVPSQQAHLPGGVLWFRPRVPLSRTPDALPWSPGAATRAGVGCKWRTTNESVKM